MAGEFLKPCPQEKPRGEEQRARTKTDTGGLVENTKALERTMLKELGNLPP